MQNEVVLQIEASGFLSDVYTVQLINRPELTQLKATLDYPAYLKRKSEQLNNAGNLEIPEGTKVTWQIGASSPRGGLEDPIAERQNRADFSIRCRARKSPMNQGSDVRAPENHCS